MAINLFKLRNLSGLTEELKKRVFKESDEVSVGETNKFRLYSKSGEESKLGWSSVFTIFNEEYTKNYKSPKAIVVTQTDFGNYAIGYGYSSFILQKYADDEFPFDFAKRIDVSNISRVATESLRIIGSKTTTKTLRNIKELNVDAGSVTKALSIIPQDTELYGSKIDVGKSLKFNENISLTEKFVDFIKNINKVIENEEPKREIPTLIEEDDEEEIERLNLEAFKLIEEERHDIDLIDLEVDGTSLIYAQDNIFRIKYGRTSFNTPTLNFNDLNKIINKINISRLEFYQKAKLEYLNDDGQTKYSKPLYEYLRVELREDRAFLYEGKWYKYNKDYFKLIQDKVSRMSNIVVHESEFDGIVDKSKDVEPDSKVKYREAKVNKYLTDGNSNWTSLDRDLFIKKYEDTFNTNTYSVEIADLIIKNGKVEYSSLKLSDYFGKELSYCFDQSIVATELLTTNREEVIDNLELDYKSIEVEIVSCWFFVKNLPKNTAGIIDLNSINSIIFKRNLCEWYDLILIKALTPKIRINTI